LPPTVPFDNLITRLIADVQDVRLLWQVGVLVLCALPRGGCGGRCGHGSISRRMPSPAGMKDSSE